MVGAFATLVFRSFGFPFSWKSTEHLRAWSARTQLAWSIARGASSAPSMDKPEDAHRAWNCALSISSSLAPLLTRARGTPTASECTCWLRLGGLLGQDSGRLLRAELVSFCDGTQGDFCAGGWTSRTRTVPASSRRRSEVAFSVVALRHLRQSQTQVCAASASSRMDLSDGTLGPMCVT